MTFPLLLPPRDQGPRVGALARRQGRGRSAPFSSHGPAGRVVRPTGTMQLTPRSRAAPFVTAIACGGVRMSPRLFSAVAQKVVFRPIHWASLTPFLPAGPVPGLVQPGEVGVVGVQMLVVVDGAMCSG